MANLLKSAQLLVSDLASTLLFLAVLLITKDDSWGSAQERLAKVLRVRSELPTGMLNIQTDWPKFAEGGLEIFKDRDDVPKRCVDRIKFRFDAEIRKTIWQHPF